MIKIDFAYFFLNQNALRLKNDIRFVLRKMKNSSSNSSDNFIFLQNSFIFKVASQ